MISYRQADLKDSLKKHNTPTLFDIIFDYDDEYEMEKFKITDIVFTDGQDPWECSELDDARLDYLNKLAVKLFDEAKKSFRYGRLTKEKSHEIYDKLSNGLKVSPRIVSLEWKDAESTGEGESERTWTTVGVV